MKIFDRSRKALNTSRDKIKKHVFHTCFSDILYRDAGNIYLTARNVCICVKLYLCQGRMGSSRRHVCGWLSPAVSFCISIQMSG